MTAPARLFGWILLHRIYQNTEEHFTPIVDPAHTDTSGTVYVASQTRRDRDKDQKG
jgi:hypothetical protein